MRPSIKLFFLFSFLFFLLPFPSSAEEKEDPLFEVLHVSRLRVKEKYLTRDYHFNLPDDLFRIEITRNALRNPTTIDLRVLRAESIPLAPSFQFSGKIYEYEIGNADSYNRKKRIELTLPAGNIIHAKVFTWDFPTGTWIPYSASRFDPKTQTFFVRSYESKFRVAIFQDHSEGKASWYKYKDCDCAASPDFPKGARLRVTNLYNGRSVIVTVNDFGPERNVFPDRVIDLDVTAFKQIARKGAGVINVKVEQVFETVAQNDDEAEEEGDI
jgi:rare lipoprotein A